MSGSTPNASPRQNPRATLKRDRWLKGEWFDNPVRMIASENEAGGRCFIHDAAKCRLSRARS